jgi:hypothetical protein
MSAVAAETRGPATVGPEQPRSPDAAAAAAGELVVLAALEEDRSPRAAAAAPTGAAVAAERVVLVAVLDSMVRVRSRDGEYVRTRKMATGERLALPNRDDLVLSTDDGGGVELVIDGRSRGLVGQPDEIVRDLVLRALEQQPARGARAGAASPLPRAAQQQ